MNQNVLNSYLFDAYNEAEHADRLVQCAQADVRNGSLDEAIESLTQAKRSSERANARIDLALDAVRRAKTEGLQS